MASLAPPAVAAAASAADVVAARDPVESYVAEIVRAYGVWLKNSTNDVFESLGHAWDPFQAIGKGGEITERLTELGFNATLRPMFGGGGTHFDVWMRKSKHVDPASELGRMLGLPVPEPSPQQASKVRAAVRDFNDMFSSWLLATDYVPGGNSPSFIVQVDELSDSSRVLLTRVLHAHGWCVVPTQRAYGPKALVTAIRIAHKPCPCGGFAANQQ